jgi:hypothetical protein
MSMVINGTSGLTMPGGQTQVGAFTSGTAVASTSGTSINFTSIPSWVKRITVMFNGVSTSGTSRIQVLLGTSGGFVSSGYTQYGGYSGAGSGGGSSTTSFLVDIGTAPVAADFRNGSMVLTNISGNTWIETHTVGLFSTVYYFYGSGGNIALANALTQVRITTVNGTDTFDAGSINILYE